MNPQNYTTKALEALQEAHQIALGNHHPTVSQEHLLAALVDQKE
jgi:ATP-dependent Clp protease ATP-binding subunit ClpA